MHGRDVPPARSPAAGSSIIPAAGSGNVLVGYGTAEADRPSPVRLATASASTPNTRCPTSNLLGPGGRGPRKWSPAGA